MGNKEGGNKYYVCLSSKNRSAFCSPCCGHSTWIIAIMLLPPFRLSIFLPQLSIVPLETGGLKQCCALGSLHAGVPSGKEDDMYGLNTYIAEPTGILQPKGIVVVIPDIFGWKFPNNRVLADDMSKKGPFIVMLPDLMDGASDAFSKMIPHVHLLPVSRSI